MLHLARIVFVGVLVALFAVALRYYAPMQEHLTVLEKRLVPMHSETAGSSHAGGNAPTSEQATPSSDSDAPLFTVDVEGIPAGMTARGTSFPLGHGLWLTARHVVATDCAQIVLIIDGNNVFAKINYLDPNADLAVLQTAAVGAPPLPIEPADPAPDESAYAFGFPKGMLGGTEDQLMGRARMRLGGRLMGEAPVLTWTELQRYPDDLPSLSGISGGPMLDENGNVIGIIVAASVRRGRNYTVAPEILHAIQHELGLVGPQPDQTPARDVVTQPVSLDNSATAMSKNARIALTYCIPAP
jgi:S1-C subfamily serine protease